MIPSREECFAILRKCGVPENVVDHSRVVRAIARALCLELNRKGEGLDPSLVEAASLLHDIAKISSLKTGESHPQAGARLLRELGFAEVAEVVRQHVVLDSTVDPGEISEASLVHYADKRVKHTTVVSLQERFADLKERYGKGPEARTWLDALERDSRSLEERIFRKISLSPETVFLGGD